MSSIPQAAINEDSQMMIGEFVPQCLNRLSGLESEIGNGMSEEKALCVANTCVGILTTAALLEVAAAFNKMAER